MVIDFLIFLDTYFQYQNHGIGITVFHLVCSFNSII